MFYEQAVCKRGGTKTEKLEVDVQSNVHSDVGFTVQRSGERKEAKKDKNGFLRFLCDSPWTT